MKENKKLLVIPIIAIFLIGIFLVISLSGEVDETDEIIYESPSLWRIYPQTNTGGVIVLIWNTTENALKYDIYRSKDGGDYTYIGYRRAISFLTLLVYRDTISSSGEYSYKIKAVYETGESDFSNIESVIVILD